MATKNQALAKAMAQRHYRIEAWWTVMRGRDEIITADSPEAALAELKRRVEEEDFEGDNDDYSNSDGPTNLEVYEVDANGSTTYHPVAREPSDQLRMEEAAKDMLAALEASVPALVRLGDFVGNVDEGGASGQGRIDRCAILLAVRDAIAKAKGAA